MPDGDLLVYLHDELIGRLKSVRDGARFCYDSAYVAAHAGGVQLSTALPVKEEPFDRESTRRWFAGLLPEDTRLRELLRFFGIATSSYLDALREVGWECAGAVRIVAPGVLGESGDGVSCERLGEVELARRLAALPTHPFDSASTMRVSLGGYQEKLCVVALGDIEVVKGCIEHLDVGLPLHGAPTTHILKPQPQRAPCRLVRGRGMGDGRGWKALTDTADSALYRERRNAGARDPSLRPNVGARKSRAPASGGLRSKALGLGPEQKYAAERSPQKSDPTFRGIAALPAAPAADPHAQMLVLLRQMAVNLVLGNTDAHAKNYSLVHDAGGGVSLSPLYDVVPACEITPQVLTLGMRIDGRIRADRIGRGELVREAESWGLSSRVAERELDAALDGLECGIAAASSLYPEAGGRHAEAARGRIAALATNRA